MRDAGKLGMQAITAFSPAQKGEIAYLERLLQLQDFNLNLVEREAIARQAAATAQHQVDVQLSEAARERRLSAEQSVQSANLEI